MNTENIGLLKEEILSILNTLPPMEHDFLKMRFGMVDGCPPTLDEIAQHFNIQKEQIRQLEAKAFRRLRHPKRGLRIVEISKTIKESNLESSHFHLFLETMEKIISGNCKRKILYFTLSLYDRVNVV
jgi:hypothetical protein